MLPTQSDFFNALSTNQYITDFNILDINEQSFVQIEEEADFLALNSYQPILGIQSFQESTLDAHRFSVGNVPSNCNSLQSNENNANILSNFNMSSNNNLDQDATISSPLGSASFGKKYDEKDDNPPLNSLQVAIAGEYVALYRFLSTPPATHYIQPSPIQKTSKINRSHISKLTSQSKGQNNFPLKKNRSYKYKKNPDFPTTEYFIDLIRLNQPISMQQIKSAFPSCAYKSLNNKCLNLIKANLLWRDFQKMYFATEPLTAHLTPETSKSVEK